jgi:hypothetical protein
MGSVPNQDHSARMPVFQILNFITRDNLGFKVIDLCGRKNLRNGEGPFAMTELNLPDSSDMNIW